MVSESGSSFLPSQPHFLCSALLLHWKHISTSWKLCDHIGCEPSANGNITMLERSDLAEEPVMLWSWAMSGFLYFFFFCVMLRHVTHVSFWHIREHTLKIPEVSWSEKPTGDVVWPGLRWDLHSGEVAQRSAVTLSVFRSHMSHWIGTAKWYKWPQPWVLLHAAT